jgi:hypothetical protein
MSDWDAPGVDELAPVAEWQTLTRIEPVSAGKVYGGTIALFGGLIGLLYAAMFVVIGLVGATEDASAGIGMVVAGVAMAVAIPVFYGMFGFIAGIILAFIFNMVTGWVGGLKMQFTKV